MNEQRDYARVLELFPHMNIERFRELKIKLYRWELENDSYLMSTVNNACARFHRTTHLEQFDTRSWKAGRCYHKGHQKWRRQDGKPLQLEDVKAIKSISMGQVNGFSGDVGDQFISLDWACDSSD